MLHVILPKDKIGSVIRGERNLMFVTDPAPVGAVIAVKASKKRRPTCLVEVVECEPDDDGYVLAIRLKPLEHVPLLLAQDSSRGYTHDPRLAMRGEPEAIPPGTLARDWLERAGRRHEKATNERVQQARAARELLDVEQRMREARAAAKRNFVDVSPELDLVRKHLRAGRSEASVLRRLELAERIANREAA